MKQPDLTFHNQRGVALFIGLIFLLLMTLVGLYVSRSSVLELRMAGNAGAKAASFENAEDGRMDAEGILKTLSNTMSANMTSDTSASASQAFNCGNLGAGYYARAGEGTGCGVLVPDALNWDGADSLPNPDNPEARYAVEYLGLDEIFETGNDVETGIGNPEKKKVFVFRVVGHGVEPSGSASTVETIYMVFKS